MPVYLFTWHAYGTWMPGRDRGYVHRQRGLLLRDPIMDIAYRRKMVFPPRRFERRHQQAVIDAAREAAAHQCLTLHVAATDPSHLHLLISWRDRRTWQQVRPKLKESLTRALNEAFPCDLQPPYRPLPTAAPQKRQTQRRWAWFAAKGSRKRVKNHAHFIHLATHYLPSHLGLKWKPDCGYFV